MIHRRTLTLLLLLAAAAVATVPAAAAEKNMVFASPYGVTTLDPSVSYSTELTYMANIYETLIRMNPPGSPERFSYVLANGFSASDDGLQYTFKLRKGVTFHDGTPFAAEAVKFSVERTIKLGKGAAFIWGDLESVQVVDDYTVKFVLKQAVPLPLIAASAYASYIISPSTKDKDTAWFNQGNAGGTDPYMLKNYKDGESWLLAKFKNYWGGWDGRHVENVLVKYTKEALIQQQMLQSGQAALVGRIPLDSSTRQSRMPRTPPLSTVPATRTTWPFSIPPGHRWTTSRCAGPLPTPCLTRTSSPSVSTEWPARPGVPCPRGSLVTLNRCSSITTIWRRPKHCWPRPAAPTAVSN